MAKTVIAIYDEIDAAYGAVKELKDHGFSTEDISILINENDTNHEEVRVFLGEVRTLTIPGIGAASTAGPLSQALLKEESSGILKALIDMGIPDEAAQSFAEGVRRGDTLVSLRTEDTAAERARDLMDLHGPYDINQRLQQWRREGWQGFDAMAAPYPSEERESEQMEQANTDWSPPTSSEAMVTFSDFNAYEADFRNHFSTTRFGSGYTYEQYQPAYRYGYNLATNQQNRERDWKEIEPEAKQYWDLRDPGAWEQTKTAVRYAWDEIHDAKIA